MPYNADLLPLAASQLQNRAIEAQQPKNVHVVSLEGLPQQHPVVFQIDLYFMLEVAVLRPNQVAVVVQTNGQMQQLFVDLSVALEDDSHF